MVEGRFSDGKRRGAFFVVPIFAETAGKLKKKKGESTGEKVLENYLCSFML